MAQLRQPPSSPPVRATQARAAELRKRLDGASGLAPRLTLDDPLPPPVNRQAVTAAEDRLGFALPSLLARLWAEVANGGFGPGYGLFGLEGGHVDDASRQPLPDLYIDAIEDSSWGRFLGETWPAKLVPICDWGCHHQSAIDCSTLEWQVIDLVDGYQRRPRGVSFARWMEDWVNGVDLWVRPLRAHGNCWQWRSQH